MPSPPGITSKAKRPSTAEHAECAERVKSFGPALDMLGEAGIIDATLCERLKAMVGFRNVAVHDYRKLNLEVVRKIIREHLGDFREFGRIVLRIDQ